MFFIFIFFYTRTLSSKMAVCFQFVCSSDLKNILQIRGQRPNMCKNQSIVHDNFISSMFIFLFYLGQTGIPTNLSGDKSFKSKCRLSTNPLLTGPLVRPLKTLNKDLRKNQEHANVYEVSSFFCLHFSKKTNVKISTQKG